MKKFFWFATGIAAGLAVAKRVSEDPNAQAALQDATKKVREFGSAVAEGFQERDTELRKPAATGPATKKAAVKKTAVKKPAAKKPATKKPAAN